MTTVKKKRSASTAPPARRHPPRRAGVPEAGPAGRVRSRRASPRLLVVFGGIGVLAVVAVVLGMVLSGGESSPASVPAVGTLKNGLPGAVQVDRLFSGIPQQGMRLGNPSAPVTLVEYLDLQCPYCKQLELQVVPGVIARYVRTGKAKLLMRPLAFVGVDSVRGRNAVIAAAQQNRAFDMTDLLYVNQRTENSGWLDDAMVAEAAASIPRLRVHELLAAATGPGVARLAARYDSLARKANVTGTPTFVVRSSLGGRGTALVAPSDAALTVAIGNLLPP
jgi:protein-disulfide isomerase